MEGARGTQRHGKHAGGHGQRREDGGDTGTREVDSGRTARQGEVLESEGGAAGLGGGTNEVGGFHELLAGIHTCEGQGERVSNGQKYPRDIGANDDRRQ